MNVHYCFDLQSVVKYTGYVYNSFGVFFSSSTHSVSKKKHEHDRLCLHGVLHCDRDVGDDESVRRIGKKKKKLPTLRTIH